MREAIDYFESANSRSAINTLLKLEELLRKVDTNQGLIDRQHLLFWAQLQRAQMNAEVGELDSALEIFHSVLKTTRLSMASWGESIKDCYCIEYMTAGQYLARVFTSQGKIGQAIGLLRDLVMEFELVTYHGESVAFSDLTSQLRYCAVFLGYTFDDRFDFMQHQPRFDPIVSLAGHWHPSIPLLGEKYEYLNSEYFYLSQSYDNLTEASASQRMALLTPLCESIDRLRRAFPEATTPKHVMITYSLWKAKCEIQLDRLEEFEMTLDETQLLLEEVSDISLSETAHLLSHVQSLVSLAIAIVYHDYESFDLKSRYFPFSYGCILTSESLMDIVMEDSILNQAVALARVVLAYAASVVYEMAGKQELALCEMNMQFAILNELLKRDPSNNKAQRLNEEWGRYLNPPVDREVSEEVQNWDWAVEVPFP